MIWIVLFPDSFRCPETGSEAINRHSAGSSLLRTCVQAGPTLIYLESFVTTQWFGKHACTVKRPPHRQGSQPGYQSSQCLFKRKSLQPQSCSATGMNPWMWFIWGSAFPHNITRCMEAAATKFMFSLLLALALFIFST
jgi:hypothetical protein